MLDLTELVGRLPYASNTTVLARSADDRLWVYKPEQGERPLWDFEWKTLAAREVLAFEVSVAMGLDLVPETVMAQGPLGPGSAQQFLDEDVEFDPRPMFSDAGLDPVLWPIAVLDVIINNADRKIGHLLRQRGTDRLWAIDNGLSFNAEPKLRTVLWGFAGQPIPDALLASVRQIADDDALHTRIERLLSPEEAAATRARATALLSSARHPEPPRDRPSVPWPVW